MAILLWLAAVVSIVVFIYFIERKSNAGDGIERTVTVYTANGEVLAKHTGLITIEMSDDSSVEFFFEGKHYIYRNCFVEIIATIKQK